MPLVLPAAHFTTMPTALKKNGYYYTHTSGANCKGQSSCVAIQYAKIWGGARDKVETISNLALK